MIVNIQMDTNEDLSNYEKNFLAALAGAEFEPDDWPEASVEKKASGISEDEVSAAVEKKAAAAEAEKKAAAEAKAEKAAAEKKAAAAPAEQTLVVAPEDGIDFRTRVEAMP